MSRIQVPPADIRQAAIDIFVGWDSPLETFFGQVYDMVVLDEDEQLILWVGTDVRSLQDVDALAHALRHYCTLSQEIRDKLTADYNNRTEPSPLQRWGRSL